MPVRIDPTDLSTLPEPHTWATYTTARTTHYKSHAALSHVKNALGGTLRRDVFWADSYVFQYVTDQDGTSAWTLRWFIPKGTPKTGHELWQTVIPRKKEVAPPPQKAIDRAMASIQKSIQYQEEQ